MKCLSFGWAVVLAIVLMIFSGILPKNEFTTTVTAFAGLGLFIWWVLSFFVDCDGYFLVKEKEKQNVS